MKAKRLVCLMVAAQVLAIATFCVFCLHYGKSPEGHQSGSLQLGPDAWDHGPSRIVFRRSARVSFLDNIYGHPQIELEFMRQWWKKLGLSYNPPPGNGQNVGYGEGHVEFARSVQVGPDADNIYIGSSTSLYP